MTHPTSGLDDVVHQRVRLGVLAVLSQAKSVDFVFLKEELGLTSGNLSRHLTVLAELTEELHSLRKLVDSLAITGE
ncbi:transcriptional regulator [Rhodococcus sp. NPDC058639]|uniref:transcriptional regulator n=1 Tax=Rhodococcus sp. NPDC058639 TaxID=3346570 RepID=UPI00365A2806